MFVTLSGKESALLNNGFPIPALGQAVRLIITWNLNLCSLSKNPNKFRPPTIFFENIMYRLIPFDMTPSYITFINWSEIQLMFTFSTNTSSLVRGGKSNLIHLNSDVCYSIDIPFLTILVSLVTFDRKSGNVKFDRKNKLIPNSTILKCNCKKALNRFQSSFQKMNVF